MEKSIISKPGIVFLQAPASIFGRIVSYFSKSDIAHTFMSIGDEYFLEADLFGLRIFDINEFNKRKIIHSYYHEDHIDMSIENKLKMTNISLFLKNKPYDYILTVSFLFKRLVNFPRAYNCVETVKYFLDKMNIPHNIESKNKPCEMIKLEKVYGWKKITS